MLGFGWREFIESSRLCLGIAIIWEVLLFELELSNKRGKTWSSLFKLFFIGEFIFVNQAFRKSVIKIQSREADSSFPQPLPNFPPSPSATFHHRLTVSLCPSSPSSFSTSLPETLAAPFGLSPPETLVIRLSLFRLTPNKLELHKHSEPFNHSIVAVNLHC